MKYVFFGTPDFAAIILEQLIKTGFIPQAVVCNPDKPVGRKKIITPPPVKILAKKHGLNIYQPANKIELLEIIKKLQPDMGIVTAFGMILPKEVLDIPKHGFINVHPSLLPYWRGPTPIQNTILNGDEKTGVSLYLMDEKIDHGPILTQQELEDYEPKSANYEELSRKLAELGGELLIETLPKFLKGEVNPLPQDESKATYTKKFSTQDAFIEPDDLEIAREKGGEKAIEIDRKIRALNPEPGVWTLSPLNGRPRRMKLLEAELTSDGILKLKKIQFEGKKPMSYN